MAPGAAQRMAKPMTAEAAMRMKEDMSDFSLESGDHAEGEILGGVISGEANHRHLIELLGGAHVPAGTGIAIQVVDVIGLKDEVFVDAVREVCFDDIAAGAGLWRNE